MGSVWLHGPLAMEEVGKKINQRYVTIEKQAREIQSVRRTSLTIAKLLQSCLTLCDPMDYSLPGSSVHGILQTQY